jgi:hypothetical protein
MRLLKLSNPFCVIPVREMPAAIPSFRRQSNSSPPSKRKSVNAAAPRIPNSSRKNTPPPCGISSMLSSASTPSIHAVSWKSPSRSPACGESLSRRHKTRRKVPAQRAAVALFALFSSFASFAPAHVALRAALSRLPSQRPLACVQQFPSCLMYAGFKRIAPEQDTGMDLNEPWITALELFNSRK